MMENPDPLQDGRKVCAVFSVYSRESGKSRLSDHTRISVLRGRQKCKIFPAKNLLSL